jgi:hypothetical protein
MHRVNNVGLRNELTMWLPHWINALWSLGETLIGSERFVKIGVLVETRRHKIAILMPAVP